MLIIFSYIFYFIASSVSPLQRRWLATNKNQDNKGQIHFVFQVTLIVALLSLVLPLFSRFELVGDYSHLLILSMVTGVVGAGFCVASYTAQKHVEAGVTSVVSNIYTPVTIILSTVFLHEKLTAVQIVGTLLLLLAIFIVSKKHHIGRFKFDKYFLLMLSSGVMLAFVLVADRALVKITGFTAGTILSWWSTCICLGIVTILTKNKSEYSKKDVMITGGLRFLQNLSWAILTFVVGNLSIVSSITTFKVVIIFIAAALFLHEREDLPRKILGSVVAVVGLLLMK